MPSSDTTGPNYIFGHIDAMYLLPFGYTAPPSAQAPQAPQAWASQSTSGLRASPFASDAGKGQFVQAWG